MNTSRITPVGPGIRAIDLGFQGLPEVIAAYLVEDAGERALIEIGPTSSLSHLLAGLQEMGVPPESIDRVLLTHIHLDHAGASGTFLRLFPRAYLYVHEVGAPHMVDPDRLIASATRIYGDRMDVLWGAFEPVPPERMTVLGDNDLVSVGRRQMQALYTPGHASHHVAFHDLTGGGVFAGDVAAVRLPGFNFVRPPTPPPDLDLDLWDASIARLEALAPPALYLTHFGPFTDVAAHLHAARARLYEWSEVVSTAQKSGADRAVMVDQLRLQGDRELLAETNDARAVERYELATPYGMTVDGYLRYFRKKGEQ